MTSQESLLPLSDAERAAKFIEFRRAQLTVELVEHAKRVRRAEKKLEELRQQETETLVAARRAGLSWADLAGAAGVTRQAVQQRVNPVLDGAGNSR